MSQSLIDLERDQQHAVRIAQRAGRATTPTRARAIWWCGSPATCICRRSRRPPASSRPRPAADRAGALQPGARSEAERHRRRHRRAARRGGAQRPDQPGDDRRQRRRKGQAAAGARDGSAARPEFTLDPALPELPTPDLTLEQAVERAYRDAGRLSGGARARARGGSGASGDHRRSAAVAPASTPTIGEIGLSPSDCAAHRSASTGAVQIPIFQGGPDARTSARSRRRPAQPARRSRGSEGARSTTKCARRSSICRRPTEQLQVATQGARSRRPAADAVARSIRRRRRQQHRNHPGAGGGRGRQRTVHLGSVWLRPREGRADPRRRHRRSHAAPVSRRHSLMAEQDVVEHTVDAAARSGSRVGVVAARRRRRRRLVRGDRRARVDRRCAGGCACDADRRARRRDGSTRAGRRQPAGRRRRGARRDRSARLPGGASTRRAPSWPTPKRRRSRRRATCRLRRRAPTSNVDDRAAAASSRRKAASTGAERELDAARARLTTAQARLREAEANAAKSGARRRAAARSAREGRGLAAAVRRRGRGGRRAEGRGRLGAVADRGSRSRHPRRRKPARAGARRRAAGARRTADRADRSAAGGGDARPGPRRPRRTCSRPRRRSRRPS